MFKPTLPEKENGTYFILPKTGEPPQAGAKPHARDMVAAINPAYLEFSKTRRTSFRPMNLLLSIWGSGILFIGLLPFTVRVFADVSRLGIDGPIVFTSLLLLSLGVAIAVPRRQLNQTHSPILLSKRLRRFYQWQGKQKGWTALNYDDVVPLVTRLTVVSTAGTSTSFFLDVGVFEPGTRKLAEFIRLSDPANDVAAQAELWEFVRAYMDGPASKVPPVAYSLPEGQEHGIHARLDRDMMGGLVDSVHRLRPGPFPMAYFGMSATIGYWADRMIPWLERRMPRPALPPELAEAMQWEGKNPYRTIPLTDIEQKAIDGQLPYMNRRWFIGMLLSTLLWGGSFVGMVGVAWHMALFQ
ncbi:MULTISPECIES: hypothetical protein [Pseudomonas]|uniref:hypothetical protein n=1 Tax=Pseudomonas TaxID=286 RepID=UPI00236240B4|nr:MULTISPECIES: hypothetical protein [Pseudomonas]WJV25578.1 hypothetical protein PSR66_05935 [Pseudomonas chlororaphis]